MSRTVAVVGAGTIGLSWSVLFAAHGWQVRVQDPRQDLAEIVDGAARQFAPGMREPVEPERISANVQTFSELAEALVGAELVQENGPEDLGFKQDLFVEIEHLAPLQTVLASSTSGIRPSDIAAQMGDGAGRLLAAHPFNPPHLLPLVEVVPGSSTLDSTVEQTVRLYRELGKTPVLVRKEKAGFVANRLQSALFREAVSLVDEGVVTPAQLDTVVTESLGPRWATGGPFLSYHLGGGPGGIRHFLEHLGPGMSRRWQDLGSPELTPDLVERLSQLVERDLPDQQQLAADRDRLEAAVLDARDRQRQRPS